MGRHRSIKRWYLIRDVFAISLREKSGNMKMLKFARRRSIIVSHLSSSFSGYILIAWTDESNLCQKFSVTELRRTGNDGCETVALHLRFPTSLKFVPTLFAKFRYNFVTQRCIYFHSYTNNSEMQIEYNGLNRNHLYIHKCVYNTIFHYNFILYPLILTFLYFS